jgi:hypothetical protein
MCLDFEWLVVKSCRNSQMASWRAKNSNSYVCVTCVLHNSQVSTAVSAVKACRQHLALTFTAAAWCAVSLFDPDGAGLQQPFGAALVCRS